MIWIGTTLAVLTAGAVWMIFQTTRK